MTGPDKLMDVAKAKIHTAEKLMDATAVKMRILAGPLAERAQLTEAREGHYAALAGIRERNEAAKAEYKRACAAAELDLTASPAPPDLEDGQHHRDALTSIGWRLADLAEEERRLLADALPEVLAIWQGQVRQPMEERAREVAALVEEVAEPLTAWWSLAHECRTAKDATERRVTGGEATRMRARPEASDVLLAALGVDLLAVRPVRGRIDRIATRTTDGQLVAADYSEATAETSRERR